MITPPDLELWATGWLRKKLATAGIAATVTNKAPSTLSTPLEKPLIIIRDDSGPRSQLTFTRSLGVSILGGTRQDDHPTKTLARTIFATMTDHETVALAAGSPVVAVGYEGCNGPYLVEDNHDVTRVYFTVEYVVVGSW
ncbi:hypothetical protein [Trueperella pyogenes]|uniref:hypothetical protein n=1 Tax=Trueperella pyogenes TaxID=1661 RepID=UPI00345D9268